MGLSILLQCNYTSVTHYLLQFCIKIANQNIIAVFVGKNYNLIKCLSQERTLLYTFLVIGKPVQKEICKLHTEKL